MNDNNTNLKPRSLGNVIRAAFVAAAASLVTACAITPASHISSQPDPNEYEPAFAAKAARAEQERAADIAAENRKEKQKVIAALRERAANDESCSTRLQADLATRGYYLQYKNSPNDTSDALFETGKEIDNFGGKDAIARCSAANNNNKAPTTTKKRKHIRVKLKPFVGPPEPYATPAMHPHALAAVDERAAQAASPAPAPQAAQSASGYASWGDRFRDAAAQATAKVDAVYDNAKAMFNWNNIKANGAEVVIGVATGCAVKVVCTHFALAAVSATVPLVGGFICFVAAGALAAGASSLATTAWKNRNNKDKEKHLLLNAFVKGAKRGAKVSALVGIGGGIGLATIGILHSAFSSHGVLHNLFTSHADAAATQAPAVPAAPQAAAPVVTPHAAAPVPVPVPAHVSSLLAPEQMRQLSPALQKLAESHNPKDMLHFCKEASFQLINHSHNNPAAMKAGAELLQKGLDIAKHANINSDTSFMLERDLNYLKNLKHLAPQAG